MLVEPTERLKFLVVFRPGLLSPTLAAQMAATFQWQPRVHTGRTRGPGEQVRPDRDVPEDLPRDHRLGRRPLRGAREDPRAGAQEDTARRAPERSAQPLAPVTPEIGNEIQQITDTFTELRLIPAKVDVKRRADDRYADVLK